MLRDQPRESSCSGPRCRAPMAQAQPMVAGNLASMGNTTFYVIKQPGDNGCARSPGLISASSPQRQASPSAPCTGWKQAGRSTYRRRGAMGGSPSCGSRSSGPWRPPAWSSWRRAVHSGRACAGRRRTRGAFLRVIFTSATQALLPADRDSKAMPLRRRNWNGTMPRCEGSGLGNGGGSQA